MNIRIVFTANIASFETRMESQEFTEMMHLVVMQTVRDALREAQKMEEIECPSIENSNTYVYSLPTPTEWSFTVESSNDEND